MVINVTCQIWWLVCKPPHILRMNMYMSHNKVFFDKQILSVIKSQMSYFYNIKEILSVLRKSLNKRWKKAYYQPKIAFSGQGQRLCGEDSQWWPGPCNIETGIKYRWIEITCVSVTGIFSNFFLTSDKGMGTCAERQR